MWTVPFRSGGSGASEDGGWAVALAWARHRFQPKWVCLSGYRRIIIYSYIYIYIYLYPYLNVCIYLQLALVSPVAGYGTLSMWIHCSLCKVFSAARPTPHHLVPVASSLSNAVSPYVLTCIYLYLYISIYLLFFLFRSLLNYPTSPQTSVRAHPLNGLRPTSKNRHRLYSDNLPPIIDSQSNPIVLNGELFQGAVVRKPDERHSLNRFVLLSRQRQNPRPVP